MSNYLVTGVAGFIASRLTEMLLRQGHTVVGVDHLNDFYDVRLKDYRISQLLGQQYVLTSSPHLSRYAETNAIDAKSRAFRFHAADIERKTDIEEIFRQNKFDAVFNLAGRAGVRYSAENPFVYLSTNTLGTLNVLECMRQFGVKKHVLASTSSLYANCPIPFREDQPTDSPQSPYAATKKAAELLAYTYYKLHGIDSTVLRYFTVYGPAGRPDMSVFRFVKWIDEGSAIKMTGDGSQSRDFTYVDDIAHGTSLAVKPLGYEIVNLGGGKRPTSIRELVSLIERKLGKGSHIQHLPMHLADVIDTQADVQKAKKILGWAPSVGVEEGIQRTVEWHQANRGWLAKINA